VIRHGCGRVKTECSSMLFHIFPLWSCFGPWSYSVVGFLA
jgi:hypothetical protein